MRSLEKLFDLEIINRTRQYFGRKAEFLAPLVRVLLIIRGLAWVPQAKKKQNRIPVVD